MNAVEFEHVSKSYAVYRSPGQRLTELATFGLGGTHSDFQALTDVSFSIPRGEVFCIIGENGSGKSTTLQLMTGILVPTSGTVRVNGRIAALLELGSGFDPEFTGRQNVFLNGAILGLSEPELRARFAAIEAFAEIGKFIDRPVRTYSSGMAIRLAFAVAIHTDPEILVVDEALAVGDAWFRRRCMNRINELRDRGLTIVMVSHSAADVRAIGDRAMWLQSGRVRALGRADEIVTRYLAANGAAGEQPESREDRSIVTGPPVPVTSIPNSDHREGSGSGSILGLAVLDEYGDPVHLLIPNSRVTLRLTFRANCPLRHPDAGFVFRNHLGLEFASTSASRSGNASGPVETGKVVTLDFHLDLPELYPGAFSFSPWVREDGELCDRIENALTLQMSRGDGPVYGYVQPPCRIVVGHQGENY